MSSIRGPGSLDDDAVTIARLHAERLEIEGTVNEMLHMLELERMNEIISALQQENARLLSEKDGSWCRHLQIPLPGSCPPATTIDRHGCALDVAKLISRMGQKKSVFPPQIFDKRCLLECSAFERFIDTRKTLARKISGGKRLDAAADAVELPKTYLPIKPESEFQYKRRTFAFLNSARDGTRTFGVCFHSTDYSDSGSESHPEAELPARNELAERVEELTKENDFLNWSNVRSNVDLKYCAECIQQISRMVFHLSADRRDHDSKTCLMQALNTLLVTQHAILRASVLSILNEITECGEGHVDLVLRNINLDHFALFDFEEIEVVAHVSQIIKRVMARLLTNLNDLQSLSPTCDILSVALNIVSKIMIPKFSRSFEPSSPPSVSTHENSSCFSTESSITSFSCASPRTYMDHARHRIDRVMKEYPEVLFDLCRTLLHCTSPHVNIACGLLAKVLGLWTADHTAAVVSYDVIPRCVNLLQDDDFNLQSDALCVIRAISHTLNPSFIDHLVHFKCHAVIVQLLQSSTFEASKSFFFYDLLAVVDDIVFAGEKDKENRDDRYSVSRYVAAFHELGAASIIKAIPLSKLAADPASSHFDCECTIKNILQTLDAHAEYLSLQEKAIPCSDDTCHFLATLADSLASLVSAHPIRVPKPRALPDDIVACCMRGDLRTIQSSWVYLHEQRQRVIRFFVSSTFTDTVYERAVLQRCVLPAVSKRAHRLGIDVVMSEMRFGIRQSLSDDGRTSEVCMAELERCHVESASLSYVLIVRCKYGFRPPPRRIPQSDFEALVLHMNLAQRDVVLQYYQLDENVLMTPQQCYNTSNNMHGSSNTLGHAYVIKNASLDPSFWSKYSQLQLALRHAASVLWQSHLSELQDSSSQHPIRFFFFSVTEEEICRGLFWKDQSSVKNDTHVYYRPIRAPNGGQLSAVGASADQISNFIDVSQKQIDTSAQDMLMKLNEMIRFSLQNFPECYSETDDSIEWQDGSGFHPSNPQHAIDLQRFACTATFRLMKALDDASQYLAVQSHLDMTEALRHLRFAVTRSSKFFGTPETSLVIKKLREYMRQSNSSGHIFVLYGASGSGKSYILAEAVHNEACNLRSPSDAVIVRFLGTSPASSNVHDLLGSLCRQLHALSDGTLTLPSDCDLQTLQDYFKNALKTWRYGRLFVFLDSLDQLDDAHAGRFLRWLPMAGLAGDVRLIVSTLPDEILPSNGKSFQCLSILKNMVAPANMVEVQPLNDVRSLLVHLLKEQRRKLTHEQLARVESIIKTCPHMQTPLVVAILSNRFCDWPSFQDIPSDNKNTSGLPFIDTRSIRALIFQEFEFLERKHGVKFVRAALSFITLAKDGISGTELSEILSLDDGVLAAVYEWWVPPVRSMPTNPLTMLLADLFPYVTRRNISSGARDFLICWYHRQFWDAANEYLFNDADARKLVHVQLFEFFTGLWAGCEKPYNVELKAIVQKTFATEEGGDRHVRSQPLCLREGCSVFDSSITSLDINVRRCREAAYHMIEGGLLSEAVAELCNFEGICARVLCGEGFLLMNHLRELDLQLQLQAQLAGSAIIQQEKVTHYIRWLQKELTIIASNPQVNVILTCSRQPLESLARVDLLAFLAHTSSPCLVSMERALFGRFCVLGESFEGLDPCVSILKHKRGVYGISFDANGERLASALSDYTIVIWNSTDGIAECTLQGHSDCVNSVAWDRAGRYLASGSRDKSVRIWDASTYNEVAVLFNHTDDVKSVCFSGSDRYLASGSCDMTVRVWDTSNFCEIAVLSCRNCIVMCVSWNQSDLYIASGCGTSDGEGEFCGTDCYDVRIWESATFTQVASLQGHSGNVASVAWDCSGKYLASGSWDESILIWDAHSFCQIIRLEGHTSCINAVAWSRSTRYLATTGGSFDDDMSVRVWDVAANFSEISGLLGHSDCVNAVAWRGDSEQCLASGSRDMSVRVWNATIFGKSPSLQGHRMAVTSVAFNINGQYLASASEDSFIIIWDLETLGQVAVLEGHSKGVLSVAWDPTGKYLASSSVDKSVRLWDASTFCEVEVLLGHTECVNAVAWDGSGRYLASCSGSFDDNDIDPRVCIWENKELRERKPQLPSAISDDACIFCKVASLCGHIAKICSVSWNSTGQYLASSSYDHTIRIWDAATFDEVTALNDAGPVYSVCWDGTGRYLATATSECVRVRDVSSYCVLSVLVFHEHVRLSDAALAWDVTGRYLAASGFFCTIGVQIWDALGQDAPFDKCVCLEDGAVYKISRSIALDGKGRYLAYGSGNSILLCDSPKY